MLIGDSSVTGCINKANLTASNYFACGIAFAEGNVTISNCKNYGTIKNTASDVPPFQISNGVYSNCEELGEAISAE